MEISFLAYIYVLLIELLRFASLFINSTSVQFSTSLCLSITISVYQHSYVGFVLDIYSTGLEIQPPTEAFHYNHNNRLLPNLYDYEANKQ